MKKFIAVITAFSFLFAHRTYAYGLAPEDFNKMYSLAHAGKVYSLREAVHRGLNIDSINANGNTGLCVAIYRGDQRAYNTFRAAGANPYHRCTNVIPTEQYENFMSSSRVIGEKETPRLAYNVIHTGYLWSPKFWTLASLGAVGIGVAAFSGGGGGGSSSPEPAPEIYNSLGTKIGTMKYIPTEDSEGSASTTKNLIFAIYSGLKQKEGEVEEIPNVLWVSGDYDPTAVVNSYKAISKPLSFADRIMVAYKMTDGLSANAPTNGNSLSNGQAAYVVSGWKTVKTKTEESSEPEFLTIYSTLKHTGGISMQGVSNAVYGIIASNLATAYNGDEGSSSGTISMSVLPEEYASNTVIGMYADTGASIINGKQGKIKASLDTQPSSASGNDIVAENSVAGMVVGIIGPHLTDLPKEYSTEEEPREVINIAKNLGTINFELKDSAITRCLMNMIGMGSYLSTSASAYYLQTDKTELTNSGLISLLYYYVEGDDSTLLLSSGNLLTSNGLQGTIGMRADTNTTATNTKSGIISINGIKDQSAGMLAVNGGTLVNNGEIKVTPDPDDKNKYLAYGYGLVSLQGTRTGGNKIINNGIVTVSQNAIYSDTDVTIDNTGTLTSTGAEAIRITDGAIETNITNKGTIEATAAKQYGIYSEAVETTNIDNSGTISSLRGSTDNYTIYSSSENVDLINSGTIIGPAGIKTDGSKTVNVVNTGTIESTSTIVSGANDGIAIHGSKDVTIQNEGTITGRCPIWVADLLNDGITNIYNTGEIKVTDNAYTALSVRAKADNTIKEVNIYNGAKLVDIDDGEEVKKEVQACTDCTPTISGGSSSAIELTGNGTILAATIYNYAKATLSSGGDGISSSAITNTITNSGTINGDNAGIHLTSSNENSEAKIYNGDKNNNKAEISGGTYGISSSAITNTIENFGTINGTDFGAYGIYLLSSAKNTITNYAGATIFGSDYGISSSAITNTIQNFGKIIGTNDTGINLDNANGSLEITNNTGAEISGGIYGISSSAITNTIENFGTITGTSISGIQLMSYEQGSQAEITNNTGAKIAGGYYGIYSQATTTTVNNYGNIESSKKGEKDTDEYSGIYLTSSVNTATINNGSEDNHNATISGGIYGIHSSATTNTIKNYGTINAPNSSSYSLHGIYLEGSTAKITNYADAKISGLKEGIHSSAITNTIENYGTISSTIANGINLTSNAKGSEANTIKNYGTIIGGSGSVGIYYDAKTTAKIENSGTIGKDIDENSSNIGIYLFSRAPGSKENPNTITNNAGATIFGKNYGIFSNAITNKITNDGTIEGSDDDGIRLTSSSQAEINNGSEDNHNAKISGGTYGVYSKAEDISVDNYGTINGDTAGIFLDSNNKALVTNNTGGIIAGKDGIVLSTDTATVNNHGTISATNDGIASQSSSTFVYNYGTIESDKNGINLNEGIDATINNGDENNHTATISGGEYGIYSEAENTTVDNYGTINGGIHIGTGTVTNEASGIINIGSNQKGFDSSTVENYGTININASNLLGIATGINQGTININASNSYGTYSSYGNTTTNKGTININDSESSEEAYTGSTGMRALNGGTSFNNGTIEINQENAYGMSVYYATAENNGTININNASYGMYAFSASIINKESGIINVSSSVSSAHGMHIESSGSATNNGTIKIDGNNSYGMYNNGGTSINNDTINLNGTGSYGMYASSGNITNEVGGTINVSSSVSSAHGMHVESSGSATNNGTIKIDGNNSYGMYNNGGTSINNDTINLNGTGSYGMYASSGSITNEEKIDVDGSSSYGMYNNGGTSTNNDTINLNGTGSYGMYNTNNSGTSTNTSNNYGDINLNISDSYGMYNSDGTSANYKNIKVNAYHSYGMYNNGGTNINYAPGTINVESGNSSGMHNIGGTDKNYGNIYVTGENSYGMYNNGGEESTNYGNIYVTGKNSRGMYVDAISSKIINDGNIYVTGENSYGMYNNGGIAKNNGKIYYSPTTSHCTAGNVATGSGGSCEIYTPSAAAPRLLTLNMMSLAAPMTEDSLASEPEIASSDNPMPKAKSYALMVDNSGILQNNGSVYLGTNPDDASYIGSNAKIINNGLMAADESATLNVDNWKKSDDAVVEATKNSVFKAGSIAGTIQAGADIVVDDHNDTTYATTDTFDGNIDNLNLTSSLYLFKASKGTNNILMTMVDGGFKDVEQGQGVSAFLNNNHKDDRRVDMFNRIRVAENKNNYAKIVNSELGLSFIPSITRQNLEFARNTASQVTDAIYSNAKDKQANFVVGADYYHNRNSSTDTQMGYDSDGINIYGVYNENLNPSVNLGLGVSVGTNYSDFDNDSNSKQNVAQFYIPVTLSTEELSWLFMPRFGVGDGEYKRYVKDDKAYKADFTTYYYGLSNQLRKEFDLGYITIEPVAELNMLSMYTSKIKENNNLYVKSQDSVSIEGGLGLYFTKKVDFTNASKLQLRFGGTYYREMADPYSSVTAGFVDTDGTYKIRGYKNGRDRGVLSMQANYNIDQFDIYVKASQYIEKNSNLLLQAGMKYNIQ